jgi:hypothetical protein
VPAEHGWHCLIADQACQHPVSLHVLATHTLAPLLPPMRDISDLPVFALSGSRFLAYATTEPPLASLGSGVVAAQHWDPSDARLETKAPQRDAFGTTQDIALSLASGVYSGAKALGELGYAYLSSPAQQRTAPLSRSAPATTALFTAAASPGYVKVLDLGREGAPVVAHFRASSHQTVALSFDPSGSLLLVSSSDGQFSHVFELRPTVKLAKVWHRYALHRGLTPAHITGTHWASDSTSVSICTASGTNRRPCLCITGQLISVTDLFALQMNGGFRDAAQAFQTGTQSNPKVPEPLSMTVKPYIRLRPPRRETLPCQPKVCLEPSMAVPPTVVWLSQNAADTALSIDKQSLHLSPASDSSPKHLMIFYPHLDTVILSELLLRPPSVSSPLLQPVSGLTALLQSKGGRVVAPLRSDRAITAEHCAAWELPTAPIAPAALPEEQGRKLEPAGRKHPK